MNLRGTKLNAFTLVELLVIIGIIGIMLAAITPSAAHYIKGISLNGAAKVLSSTLREAQEKAITEQKQYFVRFTVDVTPPFYELIRINNSTEEIQRKYTLKSNETLSLNPSITSNKIAFSPDGGPSSNGDITISNGTENKIIHITPAGFISIQ